MINNELLATRVLYIDGLHQMLMLNPLEMSTGTGVPPPPDDTVKFAVSVTLPCTVSDVVAALTLVTVPPVSYSVPVKLTVKLADRVTLPCTVSVALDLLGLIVPPVTVQLTKV